MRIKLGLVRILKVKYQNNIFDVPGLRLNFEVPTSIQETVAGQLLKSDNGILAVSAGSGNTVIGISIIVSRK
jgi:hypothetical protein